MGMDFFFWFFSETTLQESKKKLQKFPSKTFSPKKKEIWSCMGKQCKMYFFRAGFFFPVWTGSHSVLRSTQFKKKTKKNGALGISFLQRTNLVPGASVTKGETKSMNP
jgi:hypothetical protein